MIGARYLPMLFLRLPKGSRSINRLQNWEVLSNCYSRKDNCVGLLDFDSSIIRHRHDLLEKAGMHGTTVLCVRKGETVIIIADGQVTFGSQIIKPNVRKVRRIGDNVIGGFAGATADALTLFERLENQLEEHSGQLTRAAVELAKQWRTDKFLRKLDAVMVVADADISLTITGNGDVVEPHDGLAAIGSGGPYAIAAARALIDLPNMDAETIARKAMTIAADSCIYTNHNFTIERIDRKPLVALKDVPLSVSESTSSEIPDTSKTSLDQNAPEAKSLEEGQEDST